MFYSTLLFKWPWSDDQVKELFYSVCNHNHTLEIKFDLIYTCICLFLVFIAKQEPGQRRPIGTVYKGVCIKMYDIVLCNYIINMVE